MKASRHTRFRLGWRSLPAFLLAAALATAQESPPVATPAELLRGAVQEGTSPGAALLVLESGEVLEELYLGTFHEGLLLPFDSASAWLTTAAILSLVDAGSLDLDDPLVKFFPEVPQEKASIPLRQLLSHTAGLPSAHPCLAERSATLESCAGEILEEDLVATSGQDFLFSPAGLQVAGRVAEIAGGLAWEALFRRQISEPLGLQRTSYGSSQNPSLASGARGTAREYGRFLSALLPPRAGDRPLLSTVLVVEMLTDHSAGTSKVYWPLDAARGYGFGTWLVEDDEGNLWATTPGALGFTPWLLRDDGIAAVTIVSAEPEAAAEARRSLLPLLRRPAESPASTPEP